MPERATLPLIHLLFCSSALLPFCPLALLPSCSPALLLSCLLFYCEAENKVKNKVKIKVKIKVKGLKYLYKLFIKA
jgi:hypothetical protein